MGTTASALQLSSGGSGYSGYSGVGTSGYSGYSGDGTSGYSGVFGYSGVIGTSGYSGVAGSTGTSGYSGVAGATGTSGYSGVIGTSGYSGVIGTSGTSGYSGIPTSGNVSIISFDSDEAVETGDGVTPFCVPETMQTLDLTDVRCSVYTQGVTGTTDVQVRRERGAASVDMLSTKVTIGAEYTISDGIINASNDDINAGDLIFVDVDDVHSGTAPNGLITVLTFA